MLTLLLGCEQDILKPEQYTPDNANQRPLFVTTNLLSPDGSFTTGYRNYNIRADRINLSWNAANDENFLCYRLYRNNNLIHTFDRTNQTSIIDSLLSEDTRYLYTIATVVKTGLNTVDTLTVKTASIAAPEVYTRINQDNTVKVMWQDRSDIPGSFEVTVDGLVVATISESANHSADYVYSYLHSDAMQYVGYNYSVRKLGLFSNSYTQSIYVYNNYVMNPPNLSGNQVAGELSVNLTWTDNCTSETGYRVYRRILDSPGDFTLIASLNSPIQTYHLDTFNLQYDTTYQYAIKAVDTVSIPLVETDYSNFVDITLVESDALTYNFSDGLIPSNFYSYGAAPWFITPTPGSKSYSIRSGAISDDDYSELNVSLPLPYYSYVTVEFDYYVSSEAVSDYFWIGANGDWLYNWSGNTGWQHHSYSYYNYYGDSNNLKFHYYKDGSGSSGMDCAMIDNLSISYIENGKVHYATLGGEK